MTKIITVLKADGTYLTQKVEDFAKQIIASHKLTSASTITNILQAIMVFCSLDFVSSLIGIKADKAVIALLTAVIAILNGK